MNRIAAIALLAALATPVGAQTSIKGVELSATDAARVDRYCDVLRFRQQAGSGSEPDEPETISDSSSYWADGADAMDAALAKINLDMLTVRDCRDAGFYER